MRLLNFATYTPSTSIPEARAVPAIVRTAASISAAVKSGIFIFAISSNCSRFTFATLAVFGVADPLAIPAALRSNTAAGGVFVTNENERSA
uniref:Uncharacterized protein n=1 Tax=uncultured gamma proteobacterium HF0010_01E20 TaxID=710977 RepID=E0XQ70_9GAMM|nr:hypothetical protein [uncultured gamma proteobacterium HF0010_01E20]